MGAFNFYWHKHPIHRLVLRTLEARECLSAFKRQEKPVYAAQYTDFSCSWPDNLPIIICESSCVFFRSVCLSFILWPAANKIRTEPVFWLGHHHFLRLPGNDFQWHFEESSSYTATALYGILTRFHKHFAYIALNVLSYFYEIFNSSVSMSWFN